MPFGFPNAGVKHFLRQYAGLNFLRRCSFRDDKAYCPGQNIYSEVPAAGKDFAVSPKRSNPVGPDASIAKTVMPDSLPKRLFSKRRLKHNPQFPETVGRIGNDTEFGIESFRE